MPEEEVYYSFEVVRYAFNEWKARVAAEKAAAKAAAGAIRRTAAGLVRGRMPGLEVDMGRHRYQHPSVFKTKGKRPRWYFRAVVDVLVDRNRTGRVEKIVYLGFCGKIGKREAETIRDAKLKEINDSPAILQSQVKFSDLLAVYRSTYLPGLKPSSAYSFNRRLSCYIEPAFGQMQLREIDPIRVQQWIYKLEADGLSRATRRTTLVVLRSVFEAAALYGYVQTRNPCVKINLGAEGVVRDRRPLEPIEAKRLLAELDEQPLRTIFEVALFTGLRISEVLGITWGAVDIRKRTLQVRQGKSQQGILAEPKTQRSRRTVPLGFMVDRFRRPDGAGDRDLVWPDQIYQTLKTELTLRAKRAGIEFAGFGFHTARRTYSTLRDTLGYAAPSAEHMEAMGHASPEMTMHYTRRDESNLPDRMRNLVESAGETEKKVVSIR